MTDKTAQTELLGLAAKAAGYKVSIGKFNGDQCLYMNEGVGRYRVWNPLDDDGDAFRIASDINLNVNFHNRSVSWRDGQMPVPSFMQFCEDGENMRHVIVSIAAEIGRAMP